MKWVGRILYVILVALIGVFIVFMSNSEKYTAYKNDNVTLLQEKGDETEIKNFLISFSASVYSEYSYHEIEPIYNYSGSKSNTIIEGDDKTEYSIDFSIYLGHLYSSDLSISVDAYIFLVDNLVVNTGSTSLPVITSTILPTITIEFDEPLKILEDDGTIKDDVDAESGAPILSKSLTMEAIYVNDVAEYYIGFAFPIGLRKYVDKNDLKNDELVNITRIEVKYNSETEPKVRNLLSLVNDGSAKTPNTDLLNGNGENLEKQTFAINKANSFLSWSIPPSEAANNPAVYQNVIDLSPYDGIMVRNMLIFSAVVLVVTYLLFINKHVIAYVNDKKAEKAYAAKQLAKENEDSNDVLEDKKVDTTPIFTDRVEEDDGKKRKRR